MRHIPTTIGTAFGIPVLCLIIRFSFHEEFNLFRGHTRLDLGEDELRMRKRFLLSHEGQKSASRRYQQHKTNGQQNTIPVAEMGRCGACQIRQCSHHGKFYLLMALCTDAPSSAGLFATTISAA
jgi:hypothetical protein